MSALPLTDCMINVRFIQRAIMNHYVLLLPNRAGSETARDVPCGPLLHNLVSCAVRLQQLLQRCGERDGYTF